MEGRGSEPLVILPQNFGGLDPNPSNILEGGRWAASSCLGLLIYTHTRTHRHIH